MSIVPKESLEVVAQSIGVSNLAPDVLPAVASDVEYRVREIMQEAIKCMHHSKRTILTADDVESAFTLKNVEPIYGFANGDSLRFRKAAGHKDLFYVDDKNVEFKDVIETPLTKAPQEAAILAHWLAIEGVQPAIPENVSVEVHSDHNKDIKEETVPVDIKFPVKHLVSRELQSLARAIVYLMRGGKTSSMPAVIPYNSLRFRELYFDKITDLAVNKSKSIIFKEALMSLATDAGLHPLVPLFTYFIANEAMRNLNNFPVLFALMRLAGSLLRNPHLHIEPYLNQLMPSVMTCLVAKRLGNKYSDSHWDLRNFTANLLASICIRFGHVYHNLQSRVTRTLLHGFLDPTKALSQHYGAIQGLAALGPRVVHLLVLPNLKSYLQFLIPELEFDMQKNLMKRHEAWHVFRALLCAASLCMYKQVQMFPGVLRPSRPMLKCNGKVAVPAPNKRKASADNTMIQAPQKRPATESQMSLNSGEVQGAIGGFPGSLTGTSARLPLNIQQQTTPMSTSGTKFRREKGGMEQGDLGNLIPMLFECFGESTLAFIPMPELSFFL